MALQTKIVLSVVSKKAMQGLGLFWRTLKGVTGTIFSMKSALLALGGAAGFAFLAKSSLNATDSLKKTADKIGTTTEALSGLRYAAQLTGVQTNVMDMALQRFARRTAEAAKGTGEAKGALRELGVDARALVKMPLDKRMMVLADAFEGLETESDKLRIAFKLFDSEGAALVNTLSKGSDGIANMLAEAEDLGLIMSTTAAEGVENANDALTKLGSLFKGITDQTFAAFASAITAMTDKLREFIQKGVKEADGSVVGFANTLAVSLVQGFKTALTAMQSLANAFISVYNTSLQIKDGLTRAFTPDAEKNARQLTAEINELTAALKADDEQTLRSQKMRQQVRQSQEARLKQLIKLREEAKETGNALQLIDKIDFMKDFGVTLDEISSKIGTLPESLSDITPPIVDSVNNMEQAFKSWSDAIPEADMALQDLAKSSMDGLTQAMTDGITGAKRFSDAFRGLAQSVIQSLIKMFVQYKIVEPLFNFLFNGGAGGGFNPQSTSPVSGGYSRPLSPRAIGGSVQAGQPYMVGERGAEMFVPNQSGAIVPNNKMAGGNVVINQSINISTGVSQTVRAEIATLMPQITEATKSAVADARMRGGAYSKALMGG